VGRNLERLGVGVDRDTVRGFGYEWTRFDHSSRPDRELLRRFEEYFRLFPWKELSPEARGLDLGCGTGRWARFVTERTDRLYCVDASEAAVRVATRNLRGRSGCAFMVASAGQLPIKDRSLDFGYCLGVLHHTPDPLAGMTDAVRTLKPGSPFLVYLYYALDNRSSWYRAVWRASDSFRKRLSTSPMRVRYAVSQVIAVLVYYPLARLSALLDRLGADVDRIPLSAYRHLSFYAMRNDALDRFGTRVEHRFTREQLRRMMEASGLERIVISPEEPYWCALGYKR